MKTSLKPIALLVTIFALLQSGCAPSRNDVASKGQTPAATSYQPSAQDSGLTEKIERYRTENEQLQLKIDELNKQLSSTSTIPENAELINSAELAGLKTTISKQETQLLKAGAENLAWQQQLESIEGEFMTKGVEMQNAQLAFQEIQAAAQETQNELAVAHAQIDATQAQLQAVTQHVENAPKEPTYIVEILAPKTMALDASIPVSVKVSFPSIMDGSVDPEVVLTEEITAVSRYIRASLSGSNFTITAESPLILDLNAANTAAWNFQVTPTVIPLALSILPTVVILTL
ncbi:MAG: hypothetical protein ACSHX8_11110 [Opitutaceae bacterium]